MYDQEEITQLLIQGPFFKGLDTSLLQTMVPALIGEHWTRRHVIMDPTKITHRFYVLLKGRVKIYLHNKGGRELTLYLLGPGDAFNIETLLDGISPEVYAQTLDEVDVLSGPVDLWKGWLETYPSFRKAFSIYLDGRLRKVNELAGDLALHDTMTRLVHLILRHFDHIQPSQPNLIADLSHEELAHMVGTVRIVINRLLTELKQEGIVDTHSGKLRVLDLQRLLAKAEAHISTEPKGI